MLEAVFVEFNFVQVVPAIDAELAGKSEAMNIALIRTEIHRTLNENLF